MIAGSHAAAIVAWGGFGLAFVFGAAASRTNFCTMGAVSDVVNMGSWARMRMWLLAIAVAILGTHALQLAGAIDVEKSFYTRASFTWLSYVVGGLLFGVGMTLGSGCGSKTLIRIGGGNLKSLVVFVFLGIAAYATLKGILAVWRNRWIDSVSGNLAPHQDVPTLLAAWTGITLRSAEMAAALVAALGLLVFVFKDRDFRSSLEHVAGGVVVGLVIVGGWYLTGHIGYGENPDTLEIMAVGTNSHQIESLTFVAPVAYSLELVMLWTDASLAVTFGIAAVLGTIAGSAAYALASRTFRWEGFAGPGDTAAHVLGGILMGFGGVTALGCTIGQGLTGVSTLALGSMLALLSMIAGAAVTMKLQYRWIERGR